MRSQFRVKQNVKPEYLEANIPIFVTARVCTGNLWFVSNARFDNDILDSIHYLFEIDAVFVKPVGQLIKIPLRGVFSILLVCTTLDVVIRLLIHRIIS